MVHMIQDSHGPVTKIVLITPPPFVPNSQQYPDRTFEITRGYATACIETAAEAGVPVADVHSGLVKAAGGTSADRLSPFFT